MPIDGYPGQPAFTLYKEILLKSSSLQLKLRQSPQLQRQLVQLAGITSIKATALVQHKSKNSSCFHRTTTGFFILYFTCV